jgi:hypothetical protein
LGARYEKILSSFMSKCKIDLEAPKV